MDKIEEIKNFLRKEQRLKNQQEVIDWSESIESFCVKNAGCFHTQNHADGVMQEPFYLAQYYHFRAQNNLVRTYPIRITKSESPDYILTEGNESIGLDFTAATERAYKAWKSKIEKDQSQEVFMYNQIGYGGRQAEDESVEYILSRIEEKEKKLEERYRPNNPNLQKFELLIRIDHAMFGLDMEYVVSSLLKKRPLGSNFHKINLLEQKSFAYDVFGEFRKIIQSADSLFRCDSR